MNENFKKLQSQITTEFQDLFGEKISVKDKPKVEKFLSLYLKQKTTQFYGSENGMSSLGNILQEILAAGPKISADSKAETIIYKGLQDANISFQFQYKIGPFRVDFLIDDWLVFELDGPLHKLNVQYDMDRTKYIKNKGYTVLHVPLILAIFDKDSVVEKIHELAQGATKKI